MNHAYARVFVIATIAASTFGVSLIVAQESAQDAEQRVAALKQVAGREPGEAAQVRMG